ncbi:MAG: AMP-binding protein [Phenylobacterium sp.]|uniref:AMP-binding protein n=1 Tax=Phenylobacterium sp. TaxID=1871053 RepID=UPI002735F25E|nr:AMP-binding protein [Phenylobacterium sp.]MDP3750025.1 AMP-binding protein [Phenylobacterium sp.]
MSDDSLHNVGPTATLFDTAMRRYADRECMVDGDQRYTYRELGREVSRYVQLFKANGLKRGDGLSLLTRNRIEGMFVTFAAQFMGLRYTALHPLVEIDEHLFILQDAESCVLVVDADHYPAQARLGSPTLKVFSFEPFEGCIDILARLAQFDPQPLKVEAVSSELPWIYYTGGTTGRPKGVLMTHRMAVTNMLAIAAVREWPPQPRLLMASPISHMGAFNSGPVMMKGGAVIIIPRFDTLAFLEIVQQERISVALLVPTMLYAILDHPRLHEFDLSSLKLVTIGGSPISPQRLEEAIRYFGPIFTQFLGQSECGTISYLSTADHDLSKPHRLQSCGLPIEGKEIKVMNAEMQEVEVGEVGEICARGPGVTDGYWKRPEEQAKVFAGGWLHTGDLAKRDEEGYLYIVGRAKDMIISGGFNVYPKEIEDCLDEHPAVSLSAVIGVPHPKWGEAVTAFVVLKDGQTATAEELMVLVRKKRGAVVTPKTVYFVDELPLTGYKKVDKNALRKPFWEQQERQVG